MRWILIRLSLGIAILLSGSSAVFAQKLSPLAKTPNWAELDGFQETMTRREFLSLLNEVYAPGDAAKDFINVEADRAEIATRLGQPERYVLRFAATLSDRHSVERYWRPATSLPPAPAATPLEGIKIALDPGHIGGEWAKIEERWFQIGKTEPVREGTMTLAVSRLLVPKLEAAGASVYLVRGKEDPITTQRPEQLREIAKQDLQDRGVEKPNAAYRGADDPQKETSILWESEKLFYRISEIRQRAEIVNEEIKPDLTVCIHFNAEAWGDPSKPQLVDKKHFHMLVNGNYAASELRYDDVRFNMLVKLLNRSHAEELAAAETVASAFVAETGLPRYHYTTPNAAETGVTGYVWNRNLLANRLYECPVIYMEPYVMNGFEDFARIQMGAYEGERLMAGKMRKNIFQEYADALFAGLIRFYSESRQITP